MARAGLKRCIVVVALICLLVGVVAIGCGEEEATTTPATTTTATPTATTTPTTTTPPTKVTTWRLGHYFTETDFRGVTCQKWADMVTERTNGQIMAIFGGIYLIARRSTVGKLLSPGRGHA